MTLIAGNTTVIGLYLFNSAYLGTHVFDYMTAAKLARDIKSLLSQSLTIQDKNDALSQALIQGLQQQEPETIATLVSIALSISDATIIKAAFAKVSCIADLLVVCCTYPPCMTTTVVC